MNRAGKLVRARQVLGYVFLSLVLFLPAFPALADVAVSPKFGPLSAGGNADDPAIWLHPSDPSKSVMFLSDKAAGIYVYTYNGNRCQQVNFNTALNNIDARTGFQYGSQVIDIVAGNLRDAGKLAVLKINPNHNCNNDVLTILSGPASTGNTISSDSYGFTLYKRPSDGALFVFDKPKSSSPIKQWRVTGDGTKITTTLVRTLGDVSIGVAEGFVADDELGWVYFSEEAKGISKYNADPDHPVKTRLALFATADGTASDREGTSMYKCNDGTGYLILSSQGNSSFKVYERHGSNKFMKTFTANSATGTDGLDSTSGTAPGFPNGFLIIHNNPGANYFLYDWVNVAQSDLKVCPNGGAGGSPNPPSLAIVSPAFGAVIANTTVNVAYTKSGDLTSVDHVHLQLDSNAEIRDLDFDGAYQFTNVSFGAHILKGYLARVDHSKVAGTDVSVSFSITSPGQAPNADLNTDGKVDVIDLGILLSNWNSTTKPPADLNQDGRVDVVDLGILLSKWGS